MEKRESGDKANGVKKKLETKREVGALARKGNSGKEKRKAPDLLFSFQAPLRPCSTPACARRESICLWEGGEREKRRVALS